MGRSEGRDHLEDTNGRTILRCIFRMWGGGLWTDLAQDADRWWTLINEELNLGVP